MYYRIMWRSEYGLEEVDTADTLEDARYLVNEYQLAFGIGHVFYRRSFKRAGE